MTTPQPTPPAQKRGGSHWPAIGLVALLVAAAGGYYAYVRSQNRVEPADEYRELQKGYFARLGPALKLASEYRDADGDLVADPPADPAKFLKVEEIAFTVVPSEDPEQQKREQEAWQDFLAALEKATGKKVKYLSEVTGADAQLQAVREGRLHVTAFNTGLVPTAVNTAGFVPLFAPADDGGKYSYEMEILVPAGSPVKTPADLKGKTVGFTAVSSNSGAKAPIVVLKDKFGLLAGTDYKFILSGTLGHALHDLAAGK